MKAYIKGYLHKEANWGAWAGLIGLGEAAEKAGEWWGSRSDFNPQEMEQMKTALMLGGGVTGGVLGAVIARAAARKNKNKLAETVVGGSLGALAGTALGAIA